MRSEKKGGFQKRWLWILLLLLLLSGAVFFGVRLYRDYLARREYTHISEDYTVETTADFTSISTGVLLRKARAIGSSCSGLETSHFP